MSEQSLPNEVVQRLVGQLDQAIVKISHCVEQLTDSQVWTRPVNSVNSIGNLIVHIEGNLRQWGIVGVTGLADRRDRESEFSQAEIIPRHELLPRLGAVVNDCRRQWQAFDSITLLNRVNVQGFDVSVFEALLHTVAHFVGHTHQIVLLTRQLLGDQYRFHWTPEAPRGQVPL